MGKTVNIFAVLLLFVGFGCGSEELPDEELTVTGVVMNPNGERVSGATVMIVDAETNKQAAIGKTDTAGRFAIQISPGNYVAYARGERKVDGRPIQIEGMTEAFAVTPDGLTSRMTLQMYDIVRIRTLCELSEEEVNAYADKGKKELFALFSQQKFRELGVKEGQIVKVNNLGSRRDIILYAFASEKILCEMSVPLVVLDKLFGPFGSVNRNMSDVISVSIEISIVAPELFR